MFLQTPPSVNWCTNADPKSLVPVGPDAMALLSGNVVICYNLKTEVKSYFKGDNAQICAGISLLTGHNRYPLFAVAETVLRPKIFVIRYPDMDKLTVIYSSGNLIYIDIVFSDFGYLATLGSYPYYKLSLWDFRSGEMYASARTYKKCSKYSLFCNKIDVKVVIQYSMWHNQILIWQLCQGEQYTLNELATIDLSNDFTLSNFFPLTYWEEAVAYVINDFGDLFWIDVAQMTLRHVWSTPNMLPGKHSLFYNKSGLIIANEEEIYFVKRRQSHAREWYLEWMLENTNGFIKKIVSDHNNNVYAIANLGNIYSIQYAEEVTSLEPKMVTNCYVEDYSTLKGIKDEVLLMLIKGGDLRAVDLIRMNTFSTYHIDEAYSLAVHNSQPIVAVGTTTGMVYFFSYEKVRSPVELGSVYVEEVVISQIRLFDSCVFIKDETNGIHIVYSDYKSKKFEVKVSLACEPKDQWYMLDMFLLDEQRAICFISRSIDQFARYATEAWVYNWTTKTNKVYCSEFALPYVYKSLTLIQPTTMDVVEFMGVRLNDTIIDNLTLLKNSTISIAYSLKTNHFADVSCINGSRNVLTADTQGVSIHFRTHKKSKLPYIITRALNCHYELRMILKMDECFNAKYLIVLVSHGSLTSYRLPILGDSLRENKLDPDPDQVIFEPLAIKLKSLLTSKDVVELEITPAENQKKVVLQQEIRSIGKEMRELIDYDLSVIDIKKANFQKFCLNHKWLKILNEEARILCQTERNKLLDAIADQRRIRDWIFDLIKSKSTVFNIKLRSIFSNVFVESYSTRSSTNELLDRFDLFRFYEMEPLEEDIEELPDEDEDIEDMVEEEHEIVTKALKRYIIEKGSSVYDHVMAKDFELQDTNIVTFNQMYNEEAKQPIVLIDALKAEFNKNFILSKNFKEETMDNVFGTNATLQQIYRNMNCMLCLLDMEQFEPPVLSIPEWKGDENIQKILTVDDSEIKAINRRKEVVVAAAHKSGRMLLWSKEFWQRALIIMMDGVLEKLWEEEIKKTPPPPEFMLKKQEHEFNLEEQRARRDYELKLKSLEEDRKKYLRILRENEGKAFNLKKHFIVKLNEHISSINILKMKYDFAIKHERLRLLNMKLTNFKRIECKNGINNYRDEISKLIDYIGKYEKLLDFFERSHIELKGNYDVQLNRDRQIDRQFKGQFLNTIPQHLTAEMTKIYRKRPKLPNKIFSSAGICFEMARRLLTKTTQKFPLPQELIDFLGNVNSLDEMSTNCPAQLEGKYWDNFTKLRRIKIQSELRLKAINYQVSDVPKMIAIFTDEIRKLKETKTETNNTLIETMELYFDTVRNQKLELTLTLGQVEINCQNANLNVLTNSVLMHVDDINGINMLIKAAGTQKIKFMERVALFRRKVMMKEWEHKVVLANIGYMKYIIDAIEKCKVTYEFLEVLRKWNQIKDLRETTTHVGLIEEIVDQKIRAARKHVERLELRIDNVRSQLNEKKRQNNSVDRQVDNLTASVTLLSMNRDFLGEEKSERIMKTRMERVMQHGSLTNKVRSDFIKILELRTILEITRWRTYEMLPPVKAECVPTISNLDE